MKKFPVVVILLLALHYAHAQARLSFATDLSVLRNFSPDQQFFALGQTIQFNIHLAPKQSFYTWFLYHSPGKFDNPYTATAKSAGTIPSQINYRVKSTWRMREFSMGWKHFFKGTYDAEYDWSLYSLVGLGFMFTRVDNVMDPVIDTALYTIPSTPEIGTGTIDRLTVDLGLGAEIPLGGDFYIYGDLKTYLPASSYPSPFLHSNKNVPLPIMANFGLRILFGSSY